MFRYAGRTRHDLGVSPFVALEALECRRECVSAVVTRNLRS
jgi:hypothetical protein